MSDSKSSSILCLCCSGTDYQHCCRPFHAGALPHNALQLMRSRYSAYALNIPSYIMATTHLASPHYSENKFQWQRSLSSFCKQYSFHKLDILDFQEKESVATVTFTAYLSRGSRDATFTERSYFEKLNNRWLYRGGQLAEGHALHLLAAGPLRLLPLSYYGDPILKQPAHPVLGITDDIRELIAEMIGTMDACNGLGLAAPQVHQPIRVFVIREPVELTQDQWEPGEVKVFINPYLSSPSLDTWHESEGCLSIPGLRAVVERPKEITVAYTSLEGQLVHQRFSGWAARVVMHEYDHLEGILFIDRLTTEEQIKLAPVLQNLEQQFRNRRGL